MSKAETITKVYLSSKLKANQTILFPTESYRIGTSFVFLDRTIITPSLSFLHAQDPKIMKSSYSNKTIVRVLTHLTSNNPKNIMILIIEMIYFYWIIYKSSIINMFIEWWLLNVTSHLFRYPCNWTSKTILQPRWDLRIFCYKRRTLSPLM